MIFAAVAFLAFVVIPIAAFEGWRHTVFEAVLSPWRDGNGLKIPRSVVQGFLIIFCSFGYIIFLIMSGLIAVHFSPVVGVNFLSITYRLLGALVVTLSILATLTSLLSSKKPSIFYIALFFALGVTTLNMPVVMQEMLNQQ